MPSSVVACFHFQSRYVDLSTPSALPRSSNLAPWVCTTSVMLLTSTAATSLTPAPDWSWVSSFG
ncbi:hypothetical protein SALBM135S_04119 [Streptomyces alboniger]